MAIANGFGHLAGDLVSHCGRVAGFSGDSTFHLGRKRQMFFKEKNSPGFYRLAVIQNCLKHCVGPTKRVCW